MAPMLALAALVALDFAQVATSSTVHAAAHEQLNMHSGVEATGDLTSQRRTSGHGNHSLVLLDRADYREDAKAFLMTAQRLHTAKSTDKVASGLQLDEGAPLCDLTTMTYQEVITKWSKLRRRWMKKLPDNTPPVIRRHFLNRIREAFPNLLFQNNPVVIKDAVKDLGWNTDDWSERQMKIKLEGLSLPEMYFSFPTWMAESPDVGMGTNDEGTGLRTSFAEYMAKNMSSQDVFLFLAEEDATNSHRTGDPQQDEAMRRLRNLMSPTPPFAYPAKDRRGIVAIDGVGSSHGFHEHTPVWQVQIQGHKMWHLMPPTAPLSLGALGHGGTPLVRGKPYNHPNGCAFLKKVPPPPGSFKCLAEPGDMLILPAHWLHSTCGLSDYTAAAGGWLHSATPFHTYMSIDEALGSALEHIHFKLDEGGYSEEELAVTETDEQGEALADLTEKIRRLDRAAHPFDFIDKSSATHSGQDAPEQQRPALARRERRQ